MTFWVRCEARDSNDRVVGVKLLVTAVPRVGEQVRLPDIEQLYVVEGVLHRPVQGLHTNADLSAVVQLRPVSEGSVDVVVLRRARFLLGKVLQVLPGGEGLVGDPDGALLAEAIRIYLRVHPDP